MKPLVLYHANCADGFASAWVAHRAMPEAEFVPVNYGDTPPDVTGRDVFVFDFSFKRPVLGAMANVCRSMVLRDHHKTAQADLEPVDAWPDHCDFLFDMGKSGARLAWEYFHPGATSPWLVDYTEDRDLWRWKLPHSREVSAAIASHPYDFALWDRWATHIDGWNGTPGELAAEGNAILRYQSQQVENICRSAREMEMYGHKILVANTPVLQSEVAGKLAEGRPFGATYYQAADGKFRWSLRSRDGGVDVSEVAKQHGGGGRRNAAGFETRG